MFWAWPGPVPDLWGIVDVRLGPPWGIVDTRLGPPTLKEVVRRAGGGGLSSLPSMIYATIATHPKLARSGLRVLTRYLCLARKLKAATRWSLEDGYSMLMLRELPLAVQPYDLKKVGKKGCTATPA